MSYNFHYDIPNWASVFSEIMDEAGFKAGPRKSPGHIRFVEQPDGSIAELTRI